MVWRYEHCGLRVDSDVELPELRQASRGECDVRVTQQQAAPPPAPGFDVSDGRCRFTAPGAGSFEVRSGREIVVRPVESADAAMVRLFLLGSAWGAVLHQRGHIALHAGVVALDGRAFAFCGASGAGKSSVVAGLLRRGSALVSDDLPRLDLPADGPPLVWPSVSRLKLAPVALERNGWDPD